MKSLVFEPYTKIPKRNVFFFLRELSRYLKGIFGSRTNSKSAIDQSQESDNGYEPSDVESESESEDDSSDSASLVESEDDDEEDSEEMSEDEEGKTWEELEREASNADREKGNESDSEEDRKRRKMKAIGKSRAPPAGSIPKRSKLRR